MADINITAVYPSAKFIATDSLGDLQEVIGVNASSSTAILQGIQITSVEKGTTANNIDFVITENNGSDSLTASSNTITLALNTNATDYKLNEVTSAVSAVKASGSDSGLEGTAKTAGVSANGITIKLQGNQSSSEVIYDLSSNTVEINFDDDIFMLTPDALNTLLSNAPTAVTDLVDITYTSSTNPQNNISFTLSGGTESTAEIPSINSIIQSASSDVTDLVQITIVGNDSDSLTGTGSSTASGAVDSSAPELDPDKTYLIISTDDIADYDGATEETDGRKMFYGLLETATANISNLTDKPKNLVVNRGNIILVNESKMRRSYNVTATLDILDTDLASEN